jgi:hypothetical protein
VDLFKNFIVTLLIFLTSPRIVSSVLSSTTEEHEAVIFTPNADLDLTARVKITNKDFGFFEIRMIIIFAEIGGNI